MSWAENVIWWHCYPLRFVDAPARQRDESELHHRLPRLTNWLDYLIKLGCNGLKLAPIFTSVSHGYDTLDHFTVDPRLGTNSDLDALITAAHDRGIRVCLDGVFNHLSREHHLIERALEAGPGTDDGNWIKWSNGYPYVFEGNYDLVELNLAHPPVQDYVVEVMMHWLSRGIDAWRLDAAYAAGAHPWHAITTRVKTAYPNAFIFGEVIHGDYPAFIKESGLDSITEYELWKAIWSSLNDNNFHELAWTLKRHQEFCDTFLPMTFIGNHDTSRIATKLKNPQHLPLAVALLMFLPGIPSIYAGDEQGFTGEKLDQPHGDDSVRPPFPETPEGLAPFGASVLEMYQRIVGIRRRYGWLNRATVSVPEVTNTRITIALDSGSQRLHLHLDTEAGTWSLN